MQVNFGPGVRGFTLDGISEMGGIVTPGARDFTIRNSTFTSTIDIEATDANRAAPAPADAHASPDYEPLRRPTWGRDPSHAGRAKGGQSQRRWTQRQRPNNRPDLT
jgi:hypothetical protein